MEGKFHYLFHLLAWTLPIIAGQWLLAWRVFRRNEVALTMPTLICGTWFTLADYFAVKSGLWFFDEEQILGVYLGPLPLEEVLFFYVVSLIVAQSFVMLLPQRYRR